MVNIGLLGMGTVGTGVVEVLEKNSDLIYQRTGEKIYIKKILVNDQTKKRSVDISNKLTVKPEEILNDDEIHIIVELIGGFQPAYDYIKKALEKKKHVVTANKEVISKCGRELLEIANDNGVALLFEASVGGGIPVIRPLRYCLSGNKITEIVGIINGTTNYILSEMLDKSAPFEDVLRRAQELGYAESDPTADIEGFDAARKLAILSSLAFDSEIHPDDIHTEGITNITDKDILYAKSNGYIIKLLAISRLIEGGIEARVSPVLLPITHPLANVMGVFNSIMIKGYPIGEVIFYGQGAGKEPTASAVVGDIMEIIKDKDKHITYSICGCETKLTPLKNTESEFYIRIKISNKHNMVLEILKTLEKHRISIRSMLQEEINKDNIEVVIFTHKTAEHDLKKAIKELEDKDISNICNIIRCEGDE
ncbi:MAG TPA: homoserine dehydrogenase [Thermoanaerobacterales bacterium]|nr:homoserine dehydrogenase [Thermoanaerobacterales bacterium]